MDIGGVPMREYTKKIYFIEETQNIEGSYIEVKPYLSTRIKNKPSRHLNNYQKN